MSADANKRWEFLREMLPDEEPLAGNAGGSTMAHKLEGLMPLPESLIYSFVYGADLYPYCPLPKSAGENDAVLEEDPQSPGNARPSTSRKDGGCDCGKRNRGYNPHCLNDIEEQYRWLNNDVDELWEQFKRQSTHPVLQAASGALMPRTDADLRTRPCGLRNLGATCYLNAFIQTWVRNAAFVNGINDIIVTADNGNNTTGNAVAQLQMLFARMLYGRRPVQSPVEFVASLALNVLEQQDANEFYRLFLGMLESAVSNMPLMPSSLSGDGNRNFIRDLYQGQFAHTTQCLNCGHKSQRREIMMQLELAIKDRITIEESLMNYLAKEKLEHPNQYLCPICQSKQDALRYTELLQLPPVLNLQLMRFVIDWDESADVFRKKKVLSGVRIPLVLDMRPFLSASEEIDGDECIYDLKSVIVHYGESAISGHYVAHVKNNNNDEWYKCDDESVAKIDLSDTRFAFDWFVGNQQSTTPVKRRSKKSGKKSESSGKCSPPSSSPAELDEHNNGQVYYYSRNAYMLLYEKRNRDHHKLKKPVAEILHAVDAENESFIREVSVHDAKTGQYRKWFLDVYNERKQVLDIWRLENSQQDYAVLPRRWLEKWLMYPFDHAAIPSSEYSEDQAAPDFPQVVDVQSLLCNHGKWDLDCLHHGKRVHIDVVKLLKNRYQFVPYPIFKGKDLCEICTDMECSRRLNQLLHPRDISVVRQILNDEEMLRTGTENRIVSAFSNRNKINLSSDSHSLPRVWVSKDWFKEWMKKNPRFSLEQPADVCWFPNAHDYATDIVCDHGELQPNPSLRQLVPESVWSYWLANIPGFQKAFTETQSAHVQMSCVNIAFKTELDEECQKCAHAARRANDVFDSQKKLVKEERALLKSLLNPIMVENVIEAVFAKDTINGRTFYLVSSNFVNRWKQWVNDPEGFDRPECIDNSDLICEHDRIRIDVNEYTEFGSISESPLMWPWTTNKHELAADLYYYSALPLYRPIKFSSAEMNWVPFFIVSKNEWIHLTQRYQSKGPTISLTAEHLILYDVQKELPFAYTHLKTTISDDISSKIGKPAANIDTLECIKAHLHCPVCYSRARLDWSMCTVYIRVLTEDNQTGEMDMDKFDSRAVLFDPNISLPPKEQHEQPSQSIPHFSKKRAQKPVPRKRLMAIVSSGDESGNDDPHDEDFTGDSSKNHSIKSQQPVKRRKKSESGESKEISSFFQPQPASRKYAVTASKRSSTRVKHKSLFPVEISKDWNVRDFKIAIMQQTQISPIHQRLFIRGHELDENLAPLESLKLIHNQIVDMMIVDESSAFGRDMGAPAPPERGFQGTALVGHDSFQSVESTESFPAISDETNTDNFDIQGASEKTIAREDSSGVSRHSKRTVPVVVISKEKKEK